MKSALSYASEYAALGIRVIWIPKGSKAPIEKGWPSKATTDKATISQWAKHHPDCNWGLVMGDGWLAVDLDNFADASKLVEMGLPHTRTHQTAKGAHFLYRVPKGAKIGNRVKLNGHDIDIRHTGGQVVCPGSVHPSGAMYKMGDVCEIAELPPEVLAKLSAKGSKRTATVAAPRPEDVKEGARNNYVFETAMRLRREGKEGEVLTTALLEMNARLPLPLDEAEVLRTAESASKYELNGSAEGLAKMNDDVAFVREIGGVVDVRDFLVMRPRDFVTGTYANRRHLATAGDSPKLVSTAQAWLQWEERNEVKNVTFAPGAALYVDDSHRGRLLNMWRGWPVEPARGDVAPFLELVEHVLSGLPADHKDWFWRWAAYPLQHPGVKLRTAVMIHGLVQGTGKTLLGETLAALYGEAGRLIGQEQLEREFNSYMACAAFIVGDEVTTRGTKRDTAERLKNLITRPVVEVNKKFQPEYQLPNVAQFYLTSNHDDALYLEDEDRRFFVHRVVSEKLLPAFTKRFDDWQKKTNWRGALRWHLLNKVDCRSFDPYGAAPRTEARQDMVENGLDDIDNWVRQLPNAPVHPDSTLRKIGPLHTAGELRMLALGKNVGRFPSVVGVGMAMVKGGFSLAHKSRQVEIGGRPLRLWATVKGKTDEELRKMLDDYRAAYASGAGGDGAVGRSGKFRGKVVPIASP